MKGLAFYTGSYYMPATSIWMEFSYPSFFSSSAILVIYKRSDRGLNLKLDWATAATKASLIVRMDEVATNVDDVWLAN